MEEIHFQKGMGRIFMDKKRSQQKKDHDLTLSDMISDDLMKQLKEKQLELKAKEEQQEKLAEERKRRERKQREKNKSFEELLSDSNLDWREFK